MHMAMPKSPIVVLKRISSVLKLTRILFVLPNLLLEKIKDSSVIFEKKEAEITYVKNESKRYKTYPVAMYY